MAAYSRTSPFNQKIHIPWKVAILGISSLNSRFEGSTAARFEPSSDTSVFVLFHISKETIEELFDSENEDTSITRFCTSFDTNEQLLLATMPSWTHSAVCPKIDIIIHDIVKPMGLSTALHSFHIATVEGGHRRKQPDTGWGPERSAGGYSQRRSYSVTLDVAHAQSGSKIEF